MFIEKVINENQIEIIALLANEIWNEHFTAIIGQAQVDYMLEKFQSRKTISEQIAQGYLYYLIKSNDDYIGYMGVYPEKEQLFLSKLYIKASERRQGRGQKALQFLEQLALDKKLNKITLTVNKNNFNTIETYEKFGFIKVDSIIQDIGNDFVMDDYKMEKVF